MTADIAIDVPKPWRAAELERPDVILMDLEMPLMNGLEAMRVLKKNPATSNIPIVVITAGSTRDKIVDAKKIGAVDIVTKSGFGLDEFLSRIKSAIAD